MYIKIQAKNLYKWHRKLAEAEASNHHVDFSSFKLSILETRKYTKLTTFHIHLIQSKTTTISGLHSDDV